MILTASPPPASPPAATSPPILSKTPVRDIGSVFCRHLTCCLGDMRYFINTRRHAESSFPLSSLTSSDKSPPLAHLEERRAAVSLDVSSSPSGQSFGVEESSAAVHPGVNVESLFNESSIQQIIDRYTRELNFSLSATGKTAGRLILLDTVILFVSSVSDFPCLLSSRRSRLVCGGTRLRFSLSAVAGSGLREERGG